ncbi:MAG: sugar phosphate isomerase/epimerase [Lachnospiraceae bacterium]|nr:sugar phosphate isomerase/epimerase family protein [uncultured Acetatifactor sp.]MCI9229823.1 sugar phosphate isomerase/epimerase [Lachnospiraceae bacterium]MCI9572900.1 sugar phosphate isomerase/epimerase [Lachnospiraceae bacterium]
METGMNTTFDVWHPSDKVEDQRLSLERLAAAGFSWIHWTHEYDGDYCYAPSEMQQLRDWLDELGLKAGALHASKGSDRHGERGRIAGHYRKDFTSELEPNRQAGVHLIKNRIELASAMGAKEVVLHLYLPYEVFRRDPAYREVFYGQVFRSFDELMPWCQERGMRICVENLYEAPGELQIEELTRLFTRYPSDFMGLCLDTGHANLVWGNDFVDRLAKPFADRIYAVHLHENKGWGWGPGYGDAHMIPSDNGFPWKELMAALKNSVYEGPLMLEVGMEEDETVGTFLKRAMEAGDWLNSLQ